MKIFFIFGTRPEAVKMTPIIIKAKKNPFFEVKVCITGQHGSMLNQILNFFRIDPDYDLAIMQPNQNLSSITASMLCKIEVVLVKEKPDLVLIQGDTTTAFAGAMAAFYQKIPVGHIEAGLRSYNKYSPFPEEINRLLIGNIADFHFAPTNKSKENLLNENKKSDEVFVVGNTVIDALFMAIKILDKDELRYKKYFNFIDFSKKIILVTCHRRESFGAPLQAICNAVYEIASRNDVEIVYPVHLNPNVQKTVFSILGKKTNIHLLEPLEYPHLLWLMKKSHLILTDSGGIQEEAPSLGKPVLVTRNVTERIEGIEAGICILVGNDKNNIIRETLKLLDDKNAYEKMAKIANPYGDGKSAEKILHIIHEKFCNGANKK